jgi:two-component system phosphate regulon response regulator PhoB|tara:strand:+ start:1696 stop:2385 length:690 start_codon:yes stop_codon:yes gene_type:complete
MTPLILVVEDEVPLAELLSYNLKKEGFRTTLAMNGEDALSTVLVEPPDLAVIDWMLPEMSGIEVCREIRAQPETKRMPIILLTARGEESDKILGLEAGADDYVIKPYSPRELIARVRALLRRGGINSEGHIKEYADILINLETHRVTRGKDNVPLSPTGFKLLQTLMERPTHVFSRERLLGRVWGGDVFVEPRTVDVHIRRLRKALNTFGQEDVIRTVRGAGYSIDINK